MAIEKEVGSTVPGGAEEDINKSTCNNNTPADQPTQASDPRAEGDDVPPHSEPVDDWLSRIQDTHLVLNRPLAIVDGHAYAVVLLMVDKGDGQIEKQIIALRDDRQIFTIKGSEEHTSLHSLGIATFLPEVWPAHKGLSRNGLTSFLKQRDSQPNPADIFSRCYEVIDHFVDFHKSIGDQRTLCELISCYVMGTYLLDAFDVVGYLWTTGATGSGKTQVLKCVAESGLLGELLTTGGTLPTIRDAAGLGSAMCFDDAEDIDPQKRELILVGSRRGAQVMLKIKNSDGGWDTARVHAFCPKLFSATKSPDPTLRSRCIVIPMVRSTDGDRTIDDPQEHASWPLDRQTLIDDLWIVALLNLTKLRDYDRQAAQRARLVGRELDPWRGVLAVALWLQEEHGVTGLFERMEALSVAYHADRDDLEAGFDQSRFVIRALVEMFDGRQADFLVFETAQLTDRVNRLAREEGLSEGKITSAKSVGHTCSQLRFKKPPAGKNKRRWQVTRHEVDDLALAYGLATLCERNADNADDADPEADPMA